MFERRDVLQSAIAGTTLGGSISQADMGSPQTKRPFVLVHGSWHGAWCFERLSGLLSAAGHPVTAHDLPGHGLGAQYPASYSIYPRGAGFGTEASPLAAVTLADYTKQVVDIINGLLAAGQPAPVLVGHSMGGIVVQSVAETLGPSKIHHLVYIAGFMPKDNVPLLNYIEGPTLADSKLGPLLLADPTSVGVLRLDPQSASTDYIQDLEDAFYGDVDAVTKRAARNLMTPDDPVAPFAIPLHVTEDAWGAVPRTYLRCANDWAIRPACQDLMISHADEFTPQNKTNIIRLDSGHSPFFSQPHTVADNLLALV
ncbi:alpha/beta fold hydrolase [Burkholderia anthina]|uniref:alpha/beta fold hydrolase n=1 Tax=Burkholderia anthina TaxID=179879 RepID=UPI00158ACBEE|nr:alpha/beta fold hydrolase [Burkholderia anthina]